MPGNQLRGGLQAEQAGQKVQLGHWDEPEPAAGSDGKKTIFEKHNDLMGKTSSKSLSIIKMHFGHYFSYMLYCTETGRCFSNQSGEGFLHETGFKNVESEITARLYGEIWWKCRSMETA